MPTGITIKKTGRTHQGFVQAEMLALVVIVTLTGIAAVRLLGHAEEHAIAGQAASSPAEQDAFGQDSNAIGSQSQAGIVTWVRHATGLGPTAGGSRIGDFGSFANLPQSGSSTHGSGTRLSQRGEATLSAADDPFVVPLQLARVPEAQWFNVIKDKFLPDARAGRHRDPAYLRELVQALDETAPGYVDQSRFMGRVLIALAKRLDHPNPDLSGVQMVHHERALHPARIELTPNLQTTETFSRARNNGLSPEGAAFRMVLGAATYDYFGPAEFNPKLGRLRELFAPPLPKDALDIIDGARQVFGGGIPASVRDDIFAPGFHDNSPSFEPSAQIGQPSAIASAASSPTQIRPELASASSSRVSLGYLADRIRAMGLHLSNLNW